MDDLEVNTIIATYMNRECDNCGNIDVSNRCCAVVDFDKMSNKTYTQSVDESKWAIDKLLQKGNRVQSILDKWPEESDHHLCPKTLARLIAEYIKRLKDE